MKNNSRSQLGVNKPPTGQVDAGRVASLIHAKVKAMIKPKVNLLDIERLISELVRQARMKPAFFGFNNYPATSCLSVNSAVVHGIPYNYCLKEGDIVSVDFGVSSDGWIVDTARSYAVGRVLPEVKKLLDTTESSLELAIQLARPGNTVGDIGHVVQTKVEGEGFYVIRELTGHGVGKQLQMHPQIPNYGRKGAGTVLKVGMSIAIEPITALKPVSVAIADDNWTVQASEGVVSAHFEDTVFISLDGPIVLTA